MSKELDLLESEILAAIFKCSSFDYQTIRNVYLQLKSFDKTIQALKLCVATKQPLQSIVNQISDKL